MANRFPYLFLALIVILELSFLNYSQAVESECVEGDTKKVECNSCYCDGTEEYGFYWSCTRIGCSGRRRPLLLLEEEQERRKREAEADFEYEAAQVEDPLDF